MSKKKVLINTITALLAQLAVLANGLIVPRLLLGSFGSQVNGLIASISQFLSYITLLEGGVGAVILAALFKPVADNDQSKVRRIMNSATRFFRKIALGFIIYTVLVGILYPFIAETPFSPQYIFVLTIIVSISLFIQYYFSIVLRLLLIADQKIFICNCTSICTMLLNIILTSIGIHLYPQIHFVKFLSALIYIVQPIIYSLYVKNHYNLPVTEEMDDQALSQRWDGFGQNLAHFIHSNTDIVVLTLFTSLFDVSVYSIYNNVIIGIRGLVLSISSGFMAYVGRAYAEDNEKLLNRSFGQYEFAMFNVVKIICSCCLFLIVPFVMIYTTGIHDANYYQPIFAILMVISLCIYCIRDPYLQMINNAGHFKQTVKYAYTEAALNIVLSIMFVYKLGLIGVAVGTVVSMLYRLFCSVFYVYKHIFNRNKNIFLKKVLSLVATVLMVAAFVLLTDFSVNNNMFSWISHGVIIFVVSTVVTIITILLFEKTEAKVFLDLKRKNREK